MAKNLKPGIWPVNSKHWLPYGKLILKLLDRPISTSDLINAASAKYQWDASFSIQVLAWCRINEKAGYSTVYRVWHLPNADLSGLQSTKIAKNPGSRRSGRSRKKGDDGVDPLDSEALFEHAADTGE